MDEKLIHARARISGCPRPELGVLTAGNEYQVPEHLFDDAVFDRVKTKGKRSKAQKGGK